MKGEIDELPQGTPSFSPTESLNSFNMFKLVEDESLRQIARLTKEHEALLKRMAVVKAEIRKYDRLLADVRS